MNLKDIDKVHIRDVWPTEDRSFTPWLENNIDRLNKRLGTSFSVLESEKTTPSGFSADLWVEEEDEREKGVIECQFGESNHDHIGKLIAYLTAFDAKIGIWIVEEPRYEHQKSVDWLNETTDKSFYLVKIEIIEIGNSRAPLFTPIAIPSPEVKEIGEEKRELTETEKKQKEFWEELLEKSREKYSIFKNISPKTQNWTGESAGKGGLAYNYVIAKGWGRVELYIDTGSRDKNKEIFDKLHSKKDEIENEFKDELEWQKLEDRKSSRISKTVTKQGLDDRENWDKIQTEMADAMKRLMESFDHHIENL